MTYTIVNGRLATPPSPLTQSPELAQCVGVARVLIKDERSRPLGSFKILGGLVAGLAAIARHNVISVDALDDRSGTGVTLLCASDGNHGLAVAAAAQAVGAGAKIFLPRGVDPARARRIEKAAGAIIWIDGTYDDAVDAAAGAASGGEGLLIPDTTSDPHDPVVADVMRGYSVLGDELVQQFQALSCWPTHVFVQAGVGGLAAAVAHALLEAAHQPPRIIIVEPQTAPCVAEALAHGRVRRVDGDLQTSAEMLSCGTASAPAIAILQRYKAQSVTVNEAELHRAVGLASDVGFQTTASGAAGLAGLLSAAQGAKRGHELSNDSVVLLIITEVILD